jgi:hypothetical protein
MQIVRESRCFQGNFGLLTGVDRQPSGLYASQANEYKPQPKSVETATTAEIIRSNRPFGRIKILWCRWDHALGSAVGDPSQIIFFLAEKNPHLWKS